MTGNDEELETSREDAPQTTEKNRSPNQWKI
jgi:hypothetical protein